VPVTVTTMFDVVANEQDSVAELEPATLEGATLQAMLSVVRLTTALNPLTAVTVIVEVPGVPAFTVKLVGLAVTVKSCVL